MPNPRELATPNTHKVVIDLLMSEKKGKVLESPAGEGAMSLKLKELGFEVIAVDIDENSFLPKDEIKFAKVDLNQPLPFQESSFDSILCVEGLEHLENHFLVIREFARVIKKDGVLIISTPNTLNVYNRIRFFLFGSREIIQDIVDKRKEVYGEKIKELWHHPNPIDFPYLRNILEKNGFKLEAIDINRNIYNLAPKKLTKKFFYYILLFISGVVIKIANKIFSIPPKSVGTTSFPLLWSEILIIKARKI
ncbi:MAG: class I SAM-dependent methyltransferase [Endomicrobiia bacterium]